MSGPGRGDRGIHATAAAREAFLARVRAGLRDTAPRAPHHPAPASEPSHGAVSTPGPSGKAAGAEALAARFVTAAERVGVTVHRAHDAGETAVIVLALAVERQTASVCSWGPEALGVGAMALERLREAGIAVAAASAGEPPKAMRRAAAAAEIGLTGTDLAIARTGSLVLASGPGRPRAVSLLPPCHVAVVPRSRLVPDLEAAGLVLAAWYAGAPPAEGANVVLVTGPSRTADIELTLTRGVHGPREVHAVLVDEG